MCAAAAKGQRDEEAEAGAANPGGLSVEAVAAHAGQSGVGKSDSLLELVVSNT